MASFLLLIFSLATQQTTFCSCIHPGAIDDKQYDAYSLIADGKVVNVTEGRLGRVITFSIDTYFKGVGKERTVTIISPIESGMCGIFPLKGERWLMFAYAKGKSYRTNLCTRTKSMNPKVWNYSKDELEADLKFLENKRLLNSR